MTPIAQAPVRAYRAYRLGGMLAVLAAGCAPVATAGPGCRPLESAVALPGEISESSGVAFSAVHAGLLWTHNDGRDGRVFGVDSTGAVRTRLTLTEPPRDVEDVAVAPCGTGGSCIYLADTGDNYEERPEGSARIVRLPEPDALGPGTVDARAFPVRFPEGPRDVEALLVFPDERVYLVTKGRNHPVTVYRYPPPLRDDTVTLAEVQRLSEGARFLPRQVTGGAVSGDGSVVALRTYESVRFYRAAGDTLVALPDGLVNLRTLQEAQGEGVAIGPDGLVALTSEGGPAGGPSSLVFMRCALE